MMITPGSVTSAGRKDLMPILRSYPVIVTPSSASIRRPSRLGTALFARAALDAVFTAFNKNPFSQVNFIITSSVKK